jgi:2-polyprenyl-3-methyl-5-hydroxy-6-metoxy-1,4-benzoquinol methylase
VNNKFDRKYFERFYGTFNLHKLIKWHKDFLTYALRQLGEIKTSKKRALDAGCGYGGASLALYELGFDVVGIDVSSFALKIAKTNARARKSNIVLIVADICNMPITKKFDIIVCYEVLEHLPNPNSALQALYNLLNEDGIFIATTPNLESYLRHLPLYTKIFGDCWFGDFTHINLKTPHEWAHIVEGCGFSTYTIKTFHYVPFLHKLIGRFIFLNVSPKTGRSTLIIAKK